MDKSEEDELLKEWMAMKPSQRLELYNTMLELKKEKERLDSDPEAMLQFLLECHINDCPCSVCGRFVPPEEKFCVVCGQENPGFNAEAFEAFYEDPVEEVRRKDCSQPNGHFIDPDSDAKFCPVCGHAVRRLKDGN